MAIIKKDRVREHESGSARAAGGACAGRPPRSVEPIEVDGVVRGLSVVCSCGEELVIELELADPPGA